MKMKSIKTPKQFHTSNDKKGAGDFYGTGIKQKIGSVRDMYPVNYSLMGNKKTGKAPKSLA